MKITAIKTEAEFKPIEVKILIENEDELLAFQLMSRLNHTIPNSVLQSNESEYEGFSITIEKFLDILRNQISAF